MEPDYQPLPTTPQGELSALRARVVQLEDENRRLREYRLMYCHARDCVDKVFQKCKEVPEPILPDYCGWGEDKFRAVIRLAEDYRDLTEAID